MKEDHQINIPVKFGWYTSSGRFKINFILPLFWCREEADFQPSNIAWTNCVKSRWRIDGWLTDSDQNRSPWAIGSGDLKSGLAIHDTYRHILMPLQQITFENIVAKGEISHNEQFLLLLKNMFSTLFNNYYTCTFSYRYFSHFEDVFKVVCCRFVVSGKGLISFLYIVSTQWLPTII